MTACAGYQFRASSSIFNYYGIESITVPTIISYANLPNLSAAVTRETMFAISSFDDLVVYSGERDADAILIGFITSGDIIDKTITVKMRQYVESLGARSYYTPTLVNYDVGLRFVLIKNPYGKKGDPTILIDRFVPFSRSIERVAADSFTFTQNKKILEKNMDDLAIEMVTYFKEVVFNAF